MRAMRAEAFSGYKDLKLVDIPKPSVLDGRVVIRITAGGGTPLEHTILSGGYPRAKAPLVLGGEGAGVVEEGGGTAFPVGSRVMFTGPYGVSENGTYSEWLAVRNENLCLIPGNIRDVFGCRCSGCISHRPNGARPRRIRKRRDGAVACDWRGGRKCGHSVGESAGGRSMP